MTDSITVTGFVATQPRHIVTGEGLKITSFRLASNQRRYDRQAGRWVDGETNWYTISSFRQLAENATASVRKGDPVIVSGRVRVRDWTGEQKSGTTIEVEADALGHDLAWGVSTFARRINDSNRDTAESSAESTAEDQLGTSDAVSFPSAQEQETAHEEPLAAATPF